MSNTNEKKVKLAPIFGFKSGQISDKVNDKSDGNKRKRKKKSPKNGKKIEIIRKLDNNSGDNESEDTIECRRSKRLRNKVIENESIVTYNEETDEEVVCDTKFEKSVEIIDNLNESMILLEENSNTIDYWTDHKTQQCLQIDSTDEDLEIISSDNSSKFGSQQTSHETVVSSISKSEEQKECLLWTEKYKPTNSSEVIGHKVAVNRLKSWLEDWGQCDSKKDLVDSGDDSDNCLDETNACLLICGPTGSGKTSMVYAIAEELKYEILELNASMKRNGRMVSKILGEATQSHQMQRNIDSNVWMPSIQSFFNSVANNDIKRFDNNIKIVNQKKAKPKGILSYFSNQTKNSVKNSSTNSEIEIIEDKVVDKTECQSKSDSVLKISDKSYGCSLFVPKALSIATKSLILFDDIDVMIDDDFIGFWNAFNRINETTKKPVILTATQYVPYIKNYVNRLQVLTLNKPNASETVTALTKICDKEYPPPEDVDDSNVNEEFCQHLSTTYDYDIRRCLNQLQFHTHWQHIDSQSETSIDQKLDITSYYDSILFEDVMQTQFGILSNSENRDNWMKCKPTFIENESQIITVAKDIIESFHELNYNISKRRVELKELSKPIDSETIQSVSQYLSPNTNLRTILLDYCPYLSFICESESLRQSQIANHSRRSRRFMHHLDSIGFYIDNMVKTKLISAFISEESKNQLDKNSEESNCMPKMDDYFYE